MYLRSLGFFGRYPKSHLFFQLPLYLISGADFVCNLHSFCEPDPFPGLLGSAVGPGGPKIDRQIRGRICSVIFPKVCPAAREIIVKVLWAPTAFPAGPLQVSRCQARALTSQLIFRLT